MSYDTLEIKIKTNLLALAGQYTHLQRVAGTNGGEWAGPCPLCGGADRFRVQPFHSPYGRWMCRNCSGWDDVINLKSRLEHISIGESIKNLWEALQGDKLKMTSPKNSPSPLQAFNTEGGKAEAPGPEWQQQARALIDQAAAALWGPAGAAALRYLKNQRLLSDDIIRKYRLGYNPAFRFLPASPWGLPPGSKDIPLQQGIIIPCVIDRLIWNIKIRPYKKEYWQVNQSRPALFGANGLNHIALMVEGEFDAMLADQVLGQYCGVVTLGSSNNRLDLPTWGKYFKGCSRVIICYDADDQGRAGAARIGKELAGLGLPVHIWDIPTLGPGDKDITDFMKAGGNLDEWFINHLNQVAPEKESLLNTALNLGGIITASRKQNE